MDIKESVARTLELIQKGKLIQLGNSNDSDRAVLVIGLAGVGKSTLVNYLAGARLEAIPDYENSDELILETSEQVGEVRIGHTNSCETTVPNKWHDQSNAITYWDCPGFEDINEEQDIANAFYIQKLFNIAHLKILIVIQYTTLNDIRGSVFSNLIAKLGNLLNDFEKFKNGVCLVITKTGPKITKENIVGKITGIIAKNSNLSSIQTSMMKFFSENESRIEIFPSPTQKGFVSNEPRDRIINMIKNIAQYIDRSDVNITVSNKSLLVVKEMAINMNIEITKLIETICASLRTHLGQDFRSIKSLTDSKNNTNVDIIKRSLASICSIRSLIQDLAVKSKSIEQFLAEINSRLVTSKLVSEKVYIELIDDVEYLKFFQSIHKETEKTSLKLNEWVKCFQDFVLNLNKKIDDLHFETEIFLVDANHTINELIKKMQTRFDIMIQTNQEEALNFQKNLDEILQKNDYLYLIANFDNEIIKKFEIDFDFKSLKDLSDISSIMNNSEHENEDDYNNTIRIKIISELNILSLNFKSQYNEAIRGEDEKLRDDVLRLLSDYKSDMSKNLNEKSFKVIETWKKGLETALIYSNECIESLVQNLIASEIGDVEILEKIKLNLVKVGDTNLNSLDLDCVQIVKDLNELVQDKCEIIRMSGLADPDNWAADELRYFASHLKRFTLNDFEKASSVLSALEIYINESSRNSEKLVDLETYFKNLEDKLEKSKDLAENVKGIMARFHKLMLKTSDFNEDTRRIRHKLLDGIGQMKISLSEQCERTLQDEFNYIWDIFENDVRNLIKSESHKCLLSAHVFDTISSFLVKLPRTMSDFEERLKELDKQMSAHIPSESHFYQTQEALGNFLKKSNSKNQKISESLAILAINLNKKLEAEREANYEFMKKFTKNALRQFLNDLEFKIEEVTKSKSLILANELVEGLLADLKLVTFIDIKSLFDSLLEKTKKYLRPETIKIFESLKNDTSNAEHLFDFYTSQVLHKLNITSTLIKERVQSDAELVRTQEVQKCFDYFFEDMHTFIRFLDDDNNTRKFLKSIEISFNNVNAFSQLHELIDHLKLIFNQIFLQKERMVFLEFYDFRSLDSFDTVLDKYANDAIPKFALSKLSACLNLIRVKIADCEMEERAEEMKAAKRTILEDFEILNSSKKSRTSDLDSESFQTENDYSHGGIDIVSDLSGDSDYDSDTSIVFDRDDFDNSKANLSNKKIRSETEALDELQKSIFQFYETDSKRIGIEKDMLLKNEILKQIKESVESGMLLNDLIHNFQIKFKYGLKDYEYNYIIKNYTKTAFKYFVAEAQNHVDELIKSDKLNEIMQLLSHLDAFNDFLEIYKLDFFKSSKNLLLIKDLLNESMENEFLAKLKSQLWKKITLIYRSINNEIKFIQAFDNLLNEYESQFKKEEFSNDCELKLLLNNCLSIDKWMHKLEKTLDLPKFNEAAANFETAYYMSIKSVKETARGVRDKSLKNTNKNLIKIINAYFDEIKVEKKILDGRNLIEIVSSSTLILSKVLTTRVENRLNDAIEEVRFVASDAIYVDVDLDKMRWHGRNIVLYTKKIVVMKEVMWDVSGKDARNDVWLGKASRGASFGDDGKDGEGGLPGESGGCVYIHAKEIVCGCKWTIKSNGGNGGKGQDGGDGHSGKDGKDGAEMSLTLLKENYPPMGKMTGMKCGKNVRKNFELLEQVTEKTLTCDFNGKANSIRTICEIAKNSLLITSIGTAYCEAMTKDGCKITLAFYEPSRAAFLLCEGGMGEPGQYGGLGGRGGLGGKRGSPGEITIDDDNNHLFNVNVDNSDAAAKDGENGMSGNNGLNGKSGKIGMDVAYLDPSAVRDTRYYGPAKLKLVYETNSTTENAWCEYHKKYASIININMPEQIMHDRNVSEQTEQSQKLSTKKKAISVNSINQNYQMNLKTAENRIIRNKIEEANEYVQQAIKNDEVNSSLNKEKSRAYSKIRDLPNRVRNRRLKERILKQNEYQGEQLTRTVKNFQQFEPKDEKFNIYAKIQNEIQHNGLDFDLDLVIKLIRERNFNFGENEKAGDSAFHAIFGVKNSQNRYLCEHVEHYRMLLCQKVLNLSGAELNMEKIKSLIQQSLKFHALTSTMVNIYAEHLRKPNTQLSKSDLGILAYVFKMNIVVYEIDYSHEDRFVNDPTNKKIWHIFQNDGLFYRIDSHQPCLDEMFYNRLIADLMRLKSNNDQDLERFYSAKSYLKKVDLSNSNVESKLDLVDLKELKMLFEYDEKDWDEVKLYFVGIMCANDGNNYILETLIENVKFCRLETVPSYYFISYLASLAVQETNCGQIAWFMLSYEPKYWLTEIFILVLKRDISSEQTMIELKAKLYAIEDKMLIELIALKYDEAKLDVEEFKNLLDKFKSVGVLDESDLEEMENISLRDWSNELVKLEIKSWLRMLTSDWKISELNKAVHYLDSIENEYGFESIKNFLKALRSNKGSFNLEIFLKSLSKFHKKIWPFIEPILTTLSKSPLSTWESLVNAKLFNDGNDGKERSLNNVIDFISSNSNTSSNIVEFLPKIKSFIDDFTQLYASKSKILKENETILGEYNMNSIKQWVKCYSGLSQNVRDENLSEAFAIVVRGVKLVRNFVPRHTQVFTVASFLVNERHTLAQVSTGEGKSIIVAMIAILKGLCGETVDIITSSNVLAKRDADENFELFKLFEITVGHNCDEDFDKRKASYFSCVIYGEVGNFERDFLLDTFYNKNVFGGRKFENVIADEVDSMLLDRGNNVLYLSHNLADLDKLESIYIFIWQQLVKQIVDRNFPNNEQIKSAVMSNMYSLIEIEDLEFINELEIRYSVWNELLALKIINEHGIILESIETIKSKINSSKVLTIDDSNNSIVIDDFKPELIYLLDSIVNNSNKSINVPKYLYPFVERHLDTWIESAFRAFEMLNGQDYIIDIDRSGTSYDLDPNIIIIDTDTGTDQANSQWNEALHQFLQLKHKCKLSVQSLKAVFISNTTFFASYRHIYGLTGTLGSRVERNLLGSLYSVDFMTVPTALPKQFEEYDPILCCNRHDWSEKIFESAMLIATNQRSILVICENINSAELLFNIIKKKLEINENLANIQLHLYKRDYETFEIVKDDKELECGHIIIATNLAGRGTDIKISDKMNKNGGLHVCLTFLASNIRIEQQAFGRAARKGCKGSAQMIFYDQSVECLFDKDESSHNLIQSLINFRDLGEINRISDIKCYYEKFILVEEELFKRFNVKYSRLKYSLFCRSEDEKLYNLILDTVLDKWAYWLDKNSGILQESFQDNKNNSSDTATKSLSKEKMEEINSNLEVFIAYLDKIVDIESALAYLDNPNAMLKMAKIFATKGKYNECTRILDKIIRNEPEFSEFAHYYKAFCIIKRFHSFTASNTRKGIIRELKETLHKAERSFNHHIARHANYASLIEQLNGAFINDQKAFLEINSYRKQKENTIGIYNLFKKSINDILGNEINPQGFEYPGIDESVLHVVFQDLLSEGLITPVKVKRTIDVSELQAISQEFLLDATKLKRFLEQNRTFDDLSFSQFESQFDEVKSREQLWQLMKKSDVISDEYDFVMVDSRLKDNFEKYLTKFVEKQTTKLISLNTRNEIVYHHEIFLKADNYFIYDKSEFEQISTGLTNHQLKRVYKEFAFKNKKAKFNLNKLESLVKQVNSIERIDIAFLHKFLPYLAIQSRSSRIISLLVEQKFLSTDGALICFEFENLNLGQFNIYKTDLIELLSRRFIYSIELNRLKKEFDRNAKFSDSDAKKVEFTLIINPHRHIINALVEQKLYKPSRVNFAKNKEDIEENVKDVYVHKELKDWIPFSEKMFDKELIFKKSHILRHLSEVSEINENESGFWQSLEANDWAKETSTGGDEVLLASIFIDSSSTTTDIDEEKRVKSVMSSLRRVLKNKEFLKSIGATLAGSYGLRGLDTPDCAFKSVKDLIDKTQFFKNIQEVTVFGINACDEVISISEAKWTLKMILNCIAITLIGLAQIAIGVLIELFTVGAGTHVALGLIGEGIGDLIFTIESARSGYLTWRNYYAHKKQSLCTTILTAGVGMWLSRGAQVSRFGYKIGGKALSNVCGKALLKKTSESAFKELNISITRKVMQRIGWKIARGLAMGLANLSIDAIIENLLQGITKNISESIVDSVNISIDEHRVKNTLYRIYCTYGAEKSKAYIRKWNEEVAQLEWWVKSLESGLASIAMGINGGISNATKKLKKAGGSFDKLAYISKVVSFILTSSKYAASLLAIMNSVDTFLNTIEAKMRQFPVDEQTLTDSKQNHAKNSDEYKKFQLEVISEWKEILRKNVKRDIERNVLKPVMQLGAQKLFTLSKQSLKKAYRSYKTNQGIEDLKKAKDDLKSTLDDETADQSVKQSAKDKFNMKLAILMAKTTSPKLYAVILREGGPADLIAAQAIASLTGRTIVIKESDGTSRVIQPSNGASNGDPIVISHQAAKKNEFLGHFGSNESADGDGHNDNNCLFRSVIENGSIEGLSEEELREKVANYVEKGEDVQINQIFKYNWNRFEGSRGNFGGATKRMQQELQTNATETDENKKAKTETSQRLETKKPNSKKTADSLIDIEESSEPSVAEESSSDHELAPGLKLNSYDFTDNVTDVLDDKKAVITLKTEENTGNESLKSIVLPTNYDEGENGQLSGNPVGFVQRGENGRVESVIAKTNENHINTGTKTNAKTRAYANPTREPETDAGHVHSSVLGGSGTDTSNIVPESSSQNRGPHSQFDKEVKNDFEDINTNQSAHIDSSYRNEYADSEDKRPVAQYAKHKIVDNESNQILETKTNKFENFKKETQDSETTSSKSSNSENIDKAQKD